MDFNTSVEPEMLPQISQQLIADLTSLHPLPWHIESDWAHEVTDSNDDVVTKCRSLPLARAIIDFAEDYTASMVVARAEVDAETAANTSPETKHFLEQQEIDRRLARIAEGDEPDDLTDPRNR